MLVLAATGRQTEALEVYRSVHSALADLGLDPDGELRAAQQQALQQLSPAGGVARDRSPGAVAEPGADRAMPAQPAPVLPPAQLPADLAVFVGRRQELDRLGTLLPEPAGRPGTSTVVTIGGMAGVGKTTLALGTSGRRPLPGRAALRRPARIPPQRRDHQHERGDALVPRCAGRTGAAHTGQR
jgi:hypothetical protein